MASATIETIDEFLDEWRHRGSLSANEVLDALLDVRNAAVSEYDFSEEYQESLVRENEVKS